MKKLLVNSPSGAQEIIVVSAGGGYFDESRVVWDERKDGPLPSITLGGMKRTGNSLEFDQTVKDSHDSAVESASVPAKVTRYQFKLALKSIGGNAIKGLNMWVKSLPEDDDSRLYFEDSPTVERGSSAVEAARSALGNTNTQIDNIFKLAATI
jgi:hypothetical protein